MLGGSDRGTKGDYEKEKQKMGVEAPGLASDSWLEVRCAVLGKDPGHEL